MEQLQHKTFIFNESIWQQKISNSNLIMMETSKAFFKMFLLVVAFLSFGNIFGADFTVSSASQFNNLNLSPGDVVTWTNGTYSADQRISFTANGTSSNPIILKAETPGGVIFTGETTMNISGDFVIIEGFYWKEGTGTNNHVQFRKGSVYANNSTIRNCAFNNLTPDGTAKHRWIVLYGTNNTVEGCSFLNKNSPGALVLVELEYNDLNPVGHMIRNNYFYNYVKRPSGTTHAGDSETIRVGTSEFQNKSASTTVEGNYFFKADGENEIITNKSAGNTYKNNTFRRCRGSLVLRHGARATVDGNFFLGENVEGTGGIRISDSFHVITNNYIQDVISTGDKWNNPITLVGGSATTGGTSNGYQKVDDIVVAFNTIYNSDSPIFYNDRSSYDPRGVLAYNAIYTTQSNIVTGDISGTGQGMQYVGNIAGGSTIGISNAGITSANANFSADGETFKPSSSGPAANAAGSDYSTTVNFDIEGRSRPNNNMDVGAHEVSGGSGSVVFTPFTNNQVGTDVGACFLNATGVSINTCSNSSETLSISAVAQFTASASSKTATISSNVNWTVSDSSTWISVSPLTGSNNGSIAISVSENTSNSDRSGTVTVSGGGLTRTISITQAAVVVNVPVTGVTLSPSTASISVGGSQQLSPSLIPNNATDQSVSYESSNTAIATVNSDGLVTAVSQGSTTIKITTVDGGFTDTMTITVKAPSTGTNLALNKNVSATGNADGANVPANLVDGSTTSRWSVSGFPKSFTVDLGAAFNIERTELVCYNDRAYQYVIETATAENGAYSQIVDRSSNTTPGTATSPIIDDFSTVNARFVKVTVTGASGYTGSWVSLTEFRVFGNDGGPAVIPVTGVTLNPPNSELVVGETQQLSATVSPADASNKSVSYMSSNTAIATVGSNGVVTALSAGSATITVTTTDGNFSDTTSLTISSVPSPALAIPGKIEAEDFSLQNGIQTENTGDTGGGLNVGYIDTNDYMDYTVNVATAGTYDVSFRVASLSNTMNFQLRNGNTILTTVSTPTTNGWQIWKTVSATVTLGSGDQTLRVLATGGGWNINWIDFTLDTSPPGSNCTLGANLAANTTIISISDEQSTHPASNLFDGNTSNRWSANSYSQSVVIDLGDVYSIDKIQVHPYKNRAYQFLVEGSLDSSNSGFSTLTDARNNTQGGSIITRDFTAKEARFIKLTVTGASGYSGPWVSIEEFEVFCAGGQSRSLSLDKTVGFSYYPNPFSDQLQITLSSKESSSVSSIRLINLLGGIITENKELQSNNNITLDLSQELPRGMYILQVIGANGKLLGSKKVVKQ